MNIDVNALRNAISSDINSNGNNKNYEENSIKLVYPFSEGKYTVRVLYNPKGKTVQKKILRHSASDKKTKVPCLSVYGEECPVCTAVKEIESIVGKEAGVFRRYGYNTRGICYAQIVDAPDETFKDGNVKRGDIVLLMYPKTIFNAINNIMIESGEQLEEIISKNNGYTIVIENKGRSSNPAYSAQLSLKKVSVCESEEEFEKILNDLPNIAEQFVPEFPNDEIRQSAKALADSIRAEYINSSVVDPNTETVKVEKKSTSSLDKIVDTTDDIPFVIDENDTVELITDEPTETTNSENPDCFGCYKNGERKCMLCIKEIDCMKATK